MPSFLDQTAALRSEPVVRTEGLSRAYRSARRRTVRALEALDLTIGAGEIFGFLGPNGAGKTTTIKLLVGLIRPTAGRGFLLGRPLGDPRARAHLGFLPENPSFYDHLSLREFLRLCGELFGLGGPSLEARTGGLLEHLGLAREADVPMRRLSKGQVQRAGIAQALVNEPSVLILDEPMSGLDPIGRAEIREVLLELRARGATVFFSSHILSDVESICDRVGIIHAGRLRSVGRVSDLLSPAIRGYDVVVSGLEGRSAGLSGAFPVTVRPAGDRLFIGISGSDALSGVLTKLIAAGARIESVAPRRESLEEYFLREVAAGESERATAPRGETAAAERDAAPARRPAA